MQEAECKPQERQKQEHRQKQEPYALANLWRFWVPPGKFQETGPGPGSDQDQPVAVSSSSSLGTDSSTNGQPSVMGSCNKNILQGQWAKQMQTGQDYGRPNSEYYNM